MVQFHSVVRNGEHNPDRLLFLHFLYSSKWTREMLREIVPHYKQEVEVTSSTLATVF